MSAVSNMLDRLVKQIIGGNTSMVPATALFEISVIGSYTKEQVFATAHIAPAKNGGADEITGATIYLVYAGHETDDSDSRFVSGMFGGTKTKLPLTMSTSLSPLALKEKTDIAVIIAVTIPGDDVKQHYLSQTVSVYP